MKITWLGHSGFRIELERATILIDPWLDGNPMFRGHDRAAAIAGATHILLTHGHGDHASGVIPISKDLGIPVVCGHELSEWLGGQGVKSLGFGRGGTVDLNGAKVTMVAASHSSSIDFGDKGLMPAGSEAGFMIAGDGHTIYVSGDTDIMADMAWMGEYHRPDIGILACGGHYTMDMARAAWAARKWFDFQVVIPCHYRTFPLLAQSAQPLIDALPGVRVIAPEVMEAITL